MTKKTKQRRKEIDERRAAKRWSVSIPCSIEWEDAVAEGTIVNLSYQGARITGVKSVPPDGAKITVKFLLKEGNRKLKGALKSKLIYSVQEKGEGWCVYSLGMEFPEPLEKVSRLLTPLFLNLRRKELKSKKQ